MVQAESELSQISTGAKLLPSQSRRITRRVTFARVTLVQVDLNVHPASSDNMALMYGKEKDAEYEIGQSYGYTPEVSLIRLPQTTTPMWASVISSTSCRRSRRRQGLFGCSTEETITPFMARMHCTSQQTCTTPTRSSNTSVRAGAVVFQASHSVLTVPRRF